MLYKVCLEQKTEAIGRVTASTLFGAFLTAYDSFIPLDDELIQDIVLSDLFPKGVRPCGVKDNNTVYSKKDAVKTVLINRTLMSRNDDGEHVPIMAFGNMGRYWEFYSSSEILPAYELTKIVDNALLLGIGKWRNVGKGQFVRHGDIEECTIDTSIENFVALSDFIPDESIRPDIVETGYRIREAVATNGSKQSSVCLLLSGTKFKTGRQFVGKHFYDEKSNTYIHGKAIVMGV